MHAYTFLLPVYVILVEFTRPLGE